MNGERGVMKRQAGVTLVELMVALTLGLLLMAVIISLFINIKRSSTQNEAVARVQENGRFALELLRQELIHAGFFGTTVSVSDITLLSPTDPTTDCGATSGTIKGVYNLTTSTDYMNYLAQADSATVAAAYACIDTSLLKAGTDNNVLAIKRTDPATATATASDNKLYIRTDTVNSELYHNNGSTTPTVTGSDWEYEYNIYFVDNTGTLQREHLKSGATPTMESQPLLDGIDAFNIDFGIDTDGDGAPNYYTTSATPLTSATAAVSARIFVLARTTTEDSSYTDTKTYNLGSYSIDTAYGDHYHRRVYSTTVTLNDLRNRVLM